MSDKDSLYVLHHSTYLCEVSRLSNVLACRFDGEDNGFNSDNDSNEKEQEEEEEHGSSSFSDTTFEYTQKKCGGNERE